jgi:four helix bundle protein
METIKKDALQEKSFKLALRIVKLYRYLTEEKREYILSRQVMRSGTNPGAMIREAANAESGSDFIHKLGIAQKEVGETLYWLELLYQSDYLNMLEFQSLKSDSEELMKILRSSILTKKKNISNTILKNK